MQTAGKVTIGILGVVILTAVVVGGYLGGWWLKSDAVNRSGQIRQQSFEFQRADIDSARNRVIAVRDIDVQLTANPGDPALTGQRKAIVNSICSQVADVTNLPADLAGFRSTECN